MKNHRPQWAAIMTPENTGMKRCVTVDEYVENASGWRDELTRLREILNSTPLEETVKWGAPCFTHKGKNIVGLGAFKSYVGLWFFQGALLSDPNGVLVNAQEGKTKAMRQWRFESKTDIKARAIKAYVGEAIENQERGEMIKPNRGMPITVPPELKKALAKNRKAAAAFEALSPGKRREYAAHISDAKREQTRLSRVEKILPMILGGKGLHDKYRGC